MREKINVLQTRHRSLGLGGTEKSLQIITKYLDKDIFKVAVCVFAPGGVREKIIRKMGIKIYNVDSNLERFAKLIKDKKFQIVHFHGGEKPVYIKVAKKAGALAIILTDNGGWMSDPEASRLIDRHLISKMIALRYKKLYRVSNEEFHKNCMVMYYPVDLEEVKKYRPSYQEVLRQRRRLGIRPNDLAIGRIGRPDIGKWGNICVDMMPYLIKKVPNVKFLAMGMPEEMKEEIKKKKLDKYFIFLKADYRERNVIKFYCLIDILVYSSVVGESFGYVIAEAMACKKPVVVNSTPLDDNAQIELVDNGKTGFVVYSPKAFAEAIAYLASNRDMAKRMGLAGYVKVKREYEAKKSTKMLEKRILELLQAKGVEVPKKILKHYEKIHYFPSREEIDNFEFEYERRLKDCFGKPDFIKILIRKYIASSLLMQKFIRSSKLTAIRNMIIRSSGAR